MTAADKSSDAAGLSAQGITFAQDIEARLISDLLDISVVPLAASSIIALITGFVFQDTCGPVLAWGWVAAVLALNAARYFFFVGNRAQDLPPKAAHRLAWQFTATVAVSGVLWGAAGILFFPAESPPFQITLAFILGGLVAGTSGSYVTWLPAYHAYAIPALAPIIVRFFWQGDELSVVMGVVLAVFAVALAALVYKFYVSRKLSARLEIEKDWLLADLTAAKTEAEEASRAKSEFLSSMSHELRTPLNVILGFAQLLSKDVNGTLDESQAKFARQILAGGRQLLELIDRVLDYSRIDSGDVELAIERTRPRPILEQCLTAAGALAEQRSISIETQDLPLALPDIDVDKERFRQTFDNLMSNALLYNRDGGVVAIGAEEIAGNMLRIKVVDSGEGIADAQKSELFQPFNRLGRESGEIAGTGVGLALAKQFADLMGGRLGFESEEGVGSTFWVEFPLAGAGPGNPSPPASARSGSKLVLCVEDVPSNRDLMESLLTQIAGIEVIFATTGEDALETARARRPELVFLDINLPEIDGFEVLKCLRAEDGTKGIKIVAVSAKAMPEDINKGRQAGFDGYVTKPVDLGDIQRIVDEVFGV